MMKRLVLFLIVGLLSLSGTSQAALRSDTYDIAQIYEGVELDRGSKAIDNFGNVRDVEYVLTPARLDRGKYSVELTKVASNIYRIYGTDFYIETRYCYEYANRTDAVLIVESGYGYNKGEVIFVD